MDLERECVQLMAEKFYLTGEQKEDISYPHRSQLCGLFFYSKSPALAAEGLLCLYQLERIMNF